MSTGTDVGRRVRPGAKPSWRKVAIPTEHGGWSLTAEPIVLGLLVAFSWAGLAVGIAAMLGFLARTPLKLAMVDRRRGRWYPRSGLAARIASAELALIAVLAVLALVGARNPWFWVPLAVAAPLVMLELWFDFRSRSRKLVPELAGAVGVSSVAAAIALAGGLSAPVAYGLWVVLAARAAAAIPYARAQVFRARGGPQAFRQSDLAQVLALAAVAAGWFAGLMPGVLVLALVLIAGFNILALRLPPRPVKVIGFQQMVFGLGLVAVAAVATLSA